MPDGAPSLAWDLQAELGEGPVWVERDRALRFVDIKRQQIHRLALELGLALSHDTGPGNVPVNGGRRDEVSMAQST